MSGSGQPKLPPFGRLLREKREERGWSLERLAKELKKYQYEVHITTLSNYELGKRRPDGEFIFFLELCFQLTEPESMVFVRALRDHYGVELATQYKQAKGRRGKP